MTLPRHTTMTPQALKSLIRTIPDYPSPGVMFRDITTLVGDAAGLRAVVAAFEERYCNARLTAIVGIEARGFIFGAPLACMLGLAFIPARKKGKLPGPAAGQDYALEYGTDRLEIHLGSLGPHDPNPGRDSHGIRLCGRPARSGRARTSRSDRHHCIHSLCL